MSSSQRKAFLKLSNENGLCRMFKVDVLLPTECVGIPKKVSGYIVTITLSGKKSSKTDIQEKICVCQVETFAESYQAVRFAKNGGAVAVLIAGHKPYRVILPTAVINPDVLTFLDKAQPVKCTISYDSGSYTYKKVKIIAQHIQNPDESLIFETQIRIPAVLVGEAILSELDGVEIVNARILCDPITKSISFISPRNFDGKICLPENKDIGNANEIAEAASEQGAVALFIVENDRNQCDHCPLPTVFITARQHQFMQVEEGMIAHFQPQERKKQADNHSEIVDDISVLQETHNSRNPPALLNVFRSVFNHIAERVTGYPPKLKNEFITVVSNRTPWLSEVPSYSSYHKAQEILQNVDDMEENQAKEEVMNFVTAIEEAFQKKNLVADAMSILFCAKLYGKLKVISTQDVADHFMGLSREMIESIDVDICGPSLHTDEKILDDFVVELTKQLSLKKINKRNLTTFIFNVIWIRLYHCKAMQGIDNWDHICKCTSLRLLSKQEKFDMIQNYLMVNDPTCNAFVISIAGSLEDVLKHFSPVDYSSVDIQTLTLPTLSKLLKKSDDSDAVAQLDFIGRLNVVDSCPSMNNQTSDLVEMVIKRSNYELSCSFLTLENIVSLCATDNKSSKLISLHIQKSIFASLNNKTSLRAPTIGDVLNLILGNTGILLKNKEGFDALLNFTCLITTQHHELRSRSKVPNENLEIIKLFGHLYIFFSAKEISATTLPTTTRLLDLFNDCVKNTSRQYDFAIAAFIVSNKWRSIFEDSGPHPIRLALAKNIVSGTNIASSFRRDPLKLLDLTTLQFESVHQTGTLIEFLINELTDELINLCTKLDDAVSFYTSFSTSSREDASANIRNFVSKVFLQRIACWRPLSLLDLLKLNGKILLTIHEILLSLSKSDWTEDSIRMTAKQHSSTLISIITEWTSTFVMHDFNPNSLKSVIHVFSQDPDKINVLEKITDTSFPSESDMIIKLKEITKNVGVRQIIQRRGGVNVPTHPREREKDGDKDIKVMDELSELKDPLKTRESPGFFGLLFRYADQLSGCTPKLKGDFVSAISKGSPWLSEAPSYSSYHKAVAILRKVDGKEENQNKAELKCFVIEMEQAFEKKILEADALLLLFCSKLNGKLKEFGTHLLDKFMELSRKMIKSIQVNPDEPSLHTGEKTLDNFVVELMKELGFKKINKNDLTTTFTLNAIWIRLFHCKVVQRTGNWGLHLVKYTSLELLFKHEKFNAVRILLKENDPTFTALVISIAGSLEEVLNHFSTAGYCSIDILPLSLPTLKSLFTHKERRDEVSTAVARLDFIGRLHVHNENPGSRKQVADIVELVIRHSNYAASNSFRVLDDIHHHVAVDNKISVMVSNHIRKSINSCLRHQIGNKVPSISDVKNLVRGDLGILLENIEGFDSLMIFTNLFVTSEKFKNDSTYKDKIEWFGQLHAFFSGKESFELMKPTAVTQLLKSFHDYVKRCSDYDFAIAAIEVGHVWPSIFEDLERHHIRHEVAKNIASSTGIALTFKTHPNKLLDLSNFIFELDPPAETLAQFLINEIIDELINGCTQLEDAVTFYKSYLASERVYDSPKNIHNLVSKIFFQSVLSWSPSTIVDLLKPNSETLGVVCSFSQSRWIGDKIHVSPDEHLKSLISIISEWTSKFDTYDVEDVVLDIVIKEFKKDPLKIGVLEEMAGISFPSLDNLISMLGKITEKLQLIQSKLSFSVEMDGDSYVYTLSQIIMQYRISFDDNPILSGVVSKYSGNASPNVCLSNVNSDYEAIASFIEQNQVELEASCHFIAHKSILFQIRIGTWTKIYFDDFLQKIRETLNYLRSLFSEDANFTILRSAAEVVAKKDIILPGEIKAISSFARTGIAVNPSQFESVIELAKLSLSFSHFIDVCKMHNFSFTTKDPTFALLCSIVEGLYGVEGSEWNTEKCYKSGCDIFRILVPDETNMLHTMKRCFPVIKLFQVLRDCGSVFELAKEARWFGEPGGLQRFYQEYENVTNVLVSKQSFEMSVLDRLGPAMRCISVFGDSLKCESVTSMMQYLMSNNDIHNTDALPVVQQNICKVREWFSEGMDDLAAILGKFCLIQSSGILRLTSNRKDQYFPLRNLTLHFNKKNFSDESVSMNQDEIIEFVRHLGFLHYENEQSSKNASNFIFFVNELVKVAQQEQEMLYMGFCDEAINAELNLPISHTKPSQVLILLEHAKNKKRKYDEWLASLRDRYKFSLLFSLDELKLMHLCLDVNHPDPVKRILAASTRISPELWTLDECTEIICQHINEPDATANKTNIKFTRLDFLFRSLSSNYETLEPTENWLEAVFILVNKIGHFAENNLRCFESLVPSEREVVIHRVECTDERMLTSQILLLRTIYKDRCPAPFELIDGTFIKNPIQMKHTLDRVVAFPTNIFTIFNLHELSISQQEIISEFIGNSRSSDKFHLHCIQLKDTALYASPGTEVRMWNEATLTAISQSNWIQSSSVKGGSRSNVYLITSSCAGSGKTRYIKGKINEIQRSHALQSACIYIDEDFTLSNAVEAMLSKFDYTGTGERVIHFSISCGALTPNGILLNPLLLSINNFFINFLILRNVYDPISGWTFHAGTHNWTIFVELDSTTADDENLKWLQSHIPILFYCNPVKQHPPVEFIVDDQAHRVAIYLRAYDDKTIDRKFDPRPMSKRIMFVLDKSRSMLCNLGGRTALEVAIDSMLSIYDSHLHPMDFFGLVWFDHEYEVLVPFQQITSDDHKRILRDRIRSAKNAPYNGGTAMFTALNHAVSSVPLSAEHEEDTWIICLTDGASQDSDDVLRVCLPNSPDNLHLILIGVNLSRKIHGTMTQLCNKFQKRANPANKGFFLPTSANISGIEEAFKQVASRIPVSETFELDGYMTDEECRNKVLSHKPKFIDPDNKLLFSFWVNFLFRRVTVFDQNDEFNFNETHDSLGSSLMEVMLSEASQMLLRDQNRSWASTNHTQLIYDFSMKESPKFRLITTNPDLLDFDQKKRLKDLDLPGFKIPTITDLRKRETLDNFLSQALSIPLTEGQRGKKYLKCVDDNKFVLTLDFTLKLLNIHERVSCGVPCVMEGETGVSKTALTKMYSILINSSYTSNAAASTKQDMQHMRDELARLFPNFSIKGSDGCLMKEIRGYISASPKHSMDDVLSACNALKNLIHDACLRRSELFSSIEGSVVEDDILALLASFSESSLEPMFFDINIHASLTSLEVVDKFVEVRRVAQKLGGIGVKIVVFFDEINTASILSLLKECIVDRSLRGEPLEDNIVIIAACNPVRQTVSTHSSRELDLARDWGSGHYQVKPLPPSLDMIKWDFGALRCEQEKEFIHQRLLMLDEQLPKSVTQGMTEVVSSAHEFIRELAKERIESSKLLCSSSCSLDANDSVQRSRSVVSLRDIQRVFHLFRFFLHDFEFVIDKDKTNYHRQCMLLAVSVVYYLRLDFSGRQSFLNLLQNLPGQRHHEVDMIKVLDSAMKRVIEQTEIPDGVSVTRGLRENIFMTIVCSLSRTPLMIVGPPGCSKTLAVSIVTDNAHGEESRSIFYRKIARLQMFHYQCSRSSTSKEVKSVFDRAIQRQATVDKSRQQCLVFMDEAGLPEEEKESLKVLHYLLEGHMSSNPDVSFVCITNHILDAAKSNRCVCLLRPEPDEEELMSIASGVFNHKLISFEGKLLNLEEFSRHLCTTYISLMQDETDFGWFRTFFGLRDFIHMLKYLRRHGRLDDQILCISMLIAVASMERNFGGVNPERFYKLCVVFLSRLPYKNDLKKSLRDFLRPPIEVVQDSLSLEDTSANIARYNLPRYKMIIDHSEDDSIVRLLQLAGIVNDNHAFYRLSGMNEGLDMEKLNLISKVKYAAQVGDKTVFLSQASDVSECFYDLFNQHFTEIKKEDGRKSYFANIAIGGISRPCLVHPSFQCVIHVRASQLDEVPAPFLNRFEKYSLDLDNVFEWLIRKFPPGLSDVVTKSKNNVEKLLSRIGEKSIWSPSPIETVTSIYISTLGAYFNSGSLKLDELDQGIDRHKVSCAIGIYSTFLHWVRNIMKIVFSIKISDHDISSATEILLSELNGAEAMDMKKVLEFGNTLDPDRLINAFDAILFGKNETPLSQSLRKIVETVLTRHTVSVVMQLALPESLFHSRHVLPDQIIRSYFGDQNHFNIKSLLQSKDVSQLCLVFVRSDFCAHSLPMWSGDKCKSQVSRSKIENMIHEDPSLIEIHHMDMIKSESMMRATIDVWASNPATEYFFLVVGSNIQNSLSITNFIRSYVEGLGLSSEKRFMLLLHSPLSEFPKYPALCLGHWQCIYLDGIGHNEVAIDFYNIIQMACGFKDSFSSASDTLLNALVPKAMQYVASHVEFYSTSPCSKSINRDMHYLERLGRVEHLMKCVIHGQCLDSLLFKKFSKLWHCNDVSAIVQRSSSGLMSGVTHLPFSSSVRGTFQNSFNKFLANIFVEINTWMNLDTLLQVGNNSAAAEIYLLVLSNLPTTPLKELLLHKEFNRQLLPLPKELSRTKKLLDLFPFYSQISSFIDMIIDKAFSNFLDDASIEHDVRHGVAKSYISVLHRLDSIFDGIENSLGTDTTNNENSMAHAVRLVVSAVEKSPELFVKYVEQMVQWRYGCHDHVSVMKWIIKQLDDQVFRQYRGNILLAHIFCRKKEIEIIRMGSWQLVGLAAPPEKGIVGDEGDDHIILAVLNNFLSVIAEHKAIKSSLSKSCATFIRSIPSLLGKGSRISSKDICNKLRLLAFLTILVDAKATEAEVARVIELVFNDCFDNVRYARTHPNWIDVSETSFQHFWEILESFRSASSTCWTRDAQGMLLRLFFSAWWLQIMTLDIVSVETSFLLQCVKSTSMFDHSVATVCLRNMFINGPCAVKGDKFQLPLQCFSPPIAGLVSRNIHGMKPPPDDNCKIWECQHYIPHWLKSSASTPFDCVWTDDRILSWYFRNFHQSFKCPLADVVYDIFLGFISDQVSKSSLDSEGLLAIFLHSIQCQSEMGEGRCQSDQQSILATNSILRVIENDALLVCLVCKIAQELATSATSPALHGIYYSELTADLLSFLFGKLDKLSSLFFATILRLSGDAHLSSMLSQDGVLYEFKWCEPWLCSLDKDTEANLRLAEKSLKETEADEVIKLKDFRRCPHCHTMFGIDQNNCGKFTCGQDAHRVNGQPAVGGRAVKGGYGCGAAFNIGNSLPYTIDEVKLQSLRDIVESCRHAFQSYNRSALLWERARNLPIPVMSFQLSGQHCGLLPCAKLIDHMPDRGYNSTVRILANITDLKVTIEHVSYLPDMIEFYLFLHRMLRYVVTRQGAMNMKLSSLMEERLLKKRFDAINVSHLQSLWKKVVEGVDSYLNANKGQVRWECEQIDVPFTNLEGAFLISVLSENKHPSDGQDYLFLIINDIILRYNNFISSCGITPSQEHDDEIHPRMLFQGSKASIVINSAVSYAAAAASDMIESFWDHDIETFRVDDLEKTLQHEFESLSSLLPIKNPLTFLRDQFVFREGIDNKLDTSITSAARFGYVDGLVFVHSQDFELYEAVKEQTKNIGFPLPAAGSLILQPMLVNFHKFSHEQWVRLLEGMRNALQAMIKSRFLKKTGNFGQFIERLGGASFLAKTGFPEFDTMQLKFMSSLEKTDILDFIMICGNHLSSEGYRFAGLPSRLTDPVSIGMKNDIKKNVASLLHSTCGDSIRDEIDDFSRHVLSYYEKFIITASEISNDDLKIFLTKNNFCDETDRIFASLPSGLTLRNYIDLHKTLHQLKLEILRSCCEGSGFTSNLDDRKNTPTKWTWLTHSTPDDGESQLEGHSLKTVEDLWFEEAISKDNVVVMIDSQENVESKVDHSSNGGTELRYIFDHGSDKTAAPHLGSISKENSLGFTISHGNMESKVNPSSGDETGLRSIIMIQRWARSHILCEDECMDKLLSSPLYTVDEGTIELTKSRDIIPLTIALKWLATWISLLFKTSRTARRSFTSFILPVISFLVRVAWINRESKASCPEEMNTSQPVADDRDKDQSTLPYQREISNGSNVNISISNRVIARQSTTYGPGIGNTGNDCYMNGALQLLFSATQFVSDLKDSYHVLSKTKTLPLTRALLQVAMSVRMPGGSASNSTNDLEFLLAAPPSVKPLRQQVDAITHIFEGRKQHDAHEFLSHLLDFLHEELSKSWSVDDVEASSAKVPMLATDDFFRLDVKVCLTCDKCGYSRSKEESYRHLSLYMGSKKDKFRSMTLLIYHFFTPKTVDIRCEECDDGSTGTQRFEIKRLPKALILHLKRYDVDYHDRDITEQPRTSQESHAYPKTQKNKARVIIEESLSSYHLIGTEHSGSCTSQYQLSGVIHHLGDTTSCGHYTCCSKRSVGRDEQWLLYNDESCVEKSFDYVVNNERNQENCYVAMYLLS